MSLCELPEWVPLFPLPNAVLLPRAVLPLHVFEGRYRKMTEDALAGPRTIAIALLKPGYEGSYHTLDAEVYPEVGIGRILKEERLPDGRFNFLLQGVARARIVAENKEREYRLGRARVLHAPPLQPDEECSLRKRLREMLSAEPLASIAREANWTGLLGCSSLSLSEVVDLIASTVVPRPEDKQRFLAQPCIATRTRCLCDLLGTYCCGLSAAGAARRKRTWPPRNCEN